LARAAQLAPEFQKRGVKMIALSCNEASMHKEWIKDIQVYGKLDTTHFPYPIIDDKSRKLAHLLGMIDPDEIDGSGMPLTARAVILAY
jgi:peroxiredoxin 6